MLADGTFIFETGRVGTDKNDKTVVERGSVGFVSSRFGHSSKIAGGFQSLRRLLASMVSPYPRIDAMVSLGRPGACVSVSRLTQPYSSSTSNAPRAASGESSAVHPLRYTSRTVKNPSSRFQPVDSRLLKAIAA